MAPQGVSHQKLPLVNSWSRWGQLKKIVARSWLARFLKSLGGPPSQKQYWAALVAWLVFSLVEALFYAFVLKINSVGFATSLLAMCALVAKLLLQVAGLNSDRIDSLFYATTFLVYWLGFTIIYLLSARNSRVRKPEGRES